METITFEYDYPPEVEQTRQLALLGIDAAKARVAIKIDGLPRMMSELDKRRCIRQIQQDYISETKPFSEILVRCQMLATLRISIAS